MVTNTHVCTYEHSHTLHDPYAQDDLWSKGQKEPCVHPAYVSFVSFSSVQEIPQCLCYSTHLWISVCVWMFRWDKVCECIQTFPAASAAVIRYWFIVTVAMATPDWYTNPTETVRTWNHITLPSDDWQALFPWVMAWDETSITADKCNRSSFICIFLSGTCSYLVTDLIEVPDITAMLRC